MLQQFNERIKGVVAWVVVILIAFTFVIFGLDYFVQSKQSTSSLAEVNGEAIPVSLFEQVYQRVQRQDTSASQDTVIKKQILEDLIINTLALQSAAKTGFYLSPAQVTSSIMHIPQFQENGKFSVARYQQVLSASRFTPENLQREVSQGMLINQQRFAFISGAFVLPAEVARYASLLYETRDYAFSIVPMKAFMPKREVTEADAHTYYQAHLQQFTTRERVSLDYVLLSMDQFKSNAKVTEEEVRQYYQENVASYKTPARWKVSHLLYAFPAEANDKQQEQTRQKAQAAYETLIKTPTYFNELVNKESDDRLTAKQHGELPWLTLGQSPFDKVLLTLNHVDQISAPFKTNRGYELFKVIQFTPAELKPFAQVSESIRTQLLTEKAQANYAKALESLGELSYQSPDTLEPVAHALKLPILHTQPFSKEGGSDPITQNPELLKAAFSTDVKSLGNNSEPIQVNPSSVVVIRVQKQFPPQPQPFKMVQAQIEQTILNQQAKKEAEAWGLKIIKGEGLPKHLTWETVSNESREGETKHAQIRDVAFTLTQNKQVIGAFLPTGEYMLVRLDAIRPGKYDALDQEQQQALMHQLESAYGTIDYDLYMRELVETASIKRN